MNLYLVLLIQVFNHSCFRGSKVLLTLFAIELGASPLTIGILFSMYSVLPTFLSVYAGQLCDRIGARGPMILGSLGMFIGMLLPYLAPGLTTLFFSAVLTGSCYIFYTVSVQNLVGTLGGGSARTRNYGLYALCVSVTALIGPVLAGFSIEHIGGANTYLLMAALPILPIAILLLGIARFSQVGAASPQTGKRRARDLLANPRLRRILVVAGVLETGNELGNFLLPIYGHSVGLSPSEIGLMMGALAAALLLVRALIPVLIARWKESVVLSVSMCVAAIACLVFPFAQSFIPLLAAAFLMGLGIGCGAPLSMALVFNRAPDGRSGEAMGLRQTVNKGTEAVVPMVFGSVSTALGMLPVFWLVALLLGVGAWLMQREGRFDTNASP